MKKLSLPIELRQQILKHCERGYPREVCGLLIGRHDVNRVTAVIPSDNLSVHPEKSFEIDPALIIHYQKAARGGDVEIIGHYHSHPDGKAEPSQHDRGQNYDTNLIWVIVQVLNGAAQNMNAFASDNNSGKLEQIEFSFMPSK